MSSFKCSSLYAENSFRLKYWEMFAAFRLAGARVWVNFYQYDIKREDVYNSFSNDFTNLLWLYLCCIICPSVENMFFC